MLKEQIHIKLPKTIQITPDLLENFQKLNKRINFKKRFTHILVLEESKFKFEDYEFVKLKFPPKLFKNNDFDVLYDLNWDFYDFEQLGNNSINLRMGTFATISHIIAAISSELCIWSLNLNCGNTTSGNAEYEFMSSKRRTCYMADVTYLSFEKVTEKVQNTWKGRAQVAPTFAIEILSSKKPIELKRNLAKMQNIWIKNGTDIGVVIDSFRKKYYVFELNKPGYVTEEITKPFTHKLLPGYVGDFGIKADLL